MRPELIVFDMDGTLTKPCLDFDVIREQIGLDRGQPILEAIAALTPDQQVRAMAIVDQHESKAANTVDVQPGLHDTLSYLRSEGIRTAIATRNSLNSARVLMARHNIVVDALRTRDHGETKPSPAPVLEICRELNRPVDRTWVVGDYLDDILSGRAAGATTILLWTETQHPPFAQQADFVVGRLLELIDLIQGQANL